MIVATISHQIGSLGGEIADQVAQRIDLELIGSRHVHQLAESCDDDYKDACSAYEMEEFGGFLERLSFDRPAYKSLFESLNFELAGRGNVLLLGRGAQVVLRNVPGIFHARIIAPEELRVERTASAKNISSKEAWHFIQNKERHRRTLIEAVFKIDLNDYLLYGVIINTAHFQAADAADLLVQAIEKKSKTGIEDRIIGEMIHLATAKRLESIIRKQVRTAPFLEGVEVSPAPDGTLTLLGLVHSERDLAVAREIAEDFDDARKINNQLRVYSAI